MQQVADFVREEIALGHHSDKQIANYLKKVHLTEKLTQKTVTDLEAQGAGPKTVKELERLRSETANLKPPAQAATYSPATAQDNVAAIGSGTMGVSVKAAPIPPPDSIRQAQMLDAIKTYAKSYNQRLPNFICVRVTRRFVSQYPYLNRFHEVGTILARVGYHDGEEENRVYSINGKLVNMGVNEAPRGGGAFSTGEFADLMRSIFDPASQADFGWDHWGTLRGQRMAVFNYYIDSGHSSFRIIYEGGAPDQQQIVTAYKGLVYADPNTGAISRITFNAVDIPRTFPIKETLDILDYGEQQIAGNTYICPLRAELFMRSGDQKSRNDIEFRDYRKFETGFVIQYGSAAAAPPRCRRARPKSSPQALRKLPLCPLTRTARSLFRLPLRLRPSPINSRERSLQSALCGVFAHRDHARLGSRRLPAGEHALGSVAGEGGDQRHARCIGRMLAGRVVADVHPALRNLARE